jgi:photosystem II stability/assembly factor-like uncharacterized protein
MTRLCFRGSRLSFLFFVAICTNADAQWLQTNGPYDADVNAILSVGTKLFAATNYAGIYRSNDSGRLWTAASYGLGVSNIYSLAFSNATLFAGTRQGVYVSHDSGTSWYPSYVGLPFNLVVGALAASGDTVFAGTDAYGVFRSTDLGATWHAADTGLTNKFIHALLIHGDTVYAGTGGAGIFLSPDRGAHWQSADSALANVYVRAIGYEGNTLLVGLSVSKYTALIFISSNGGRNWVEADSGVRGQTRDILCFAMLDGALYAGSNLGLFRSVDSGKTWANSGLGYVNGMARIGSDLFLGGELGAFETTNSGLSWNEIDDGMGFTWVTAMEIMGKDLFAGTYYGGLYLSKDDGDNWSYSGLSYMDITCLATSDTMLYASTVPYGVYISPDSGVSWHASTGGPANQNVHSIAAGGSYVFAGTEDGVYRSSDFGANWSPGDSTLSGVYVYSVGVFDSTAFAGTNVGVFYSTNHGVTWNASNFPNYYVFGFGKLGNILFAAAYYFGPYKSTDNGRNWYPATNGFPAGADIFSLKVSGSTIYAGSDAGVYLSLDSGTTWFEIDDGLTNTNVQTLGPLGAYLFAGTYYGGVWKYPLGDHVAVATSTNSELSFDHVYPNPVRAAAQIGYSLASPSSVSLTITDEMGRAIAITENNRVLSAGHHSLRWDAHDCANGVYLCRLTVGNASVTQKIVVLH